MHRNNIYAWVLLTAWIAGTGCTTLREVPRSEYAARPQRDHVKITTNEGLEYEFDYVRVDEDTLVGYRERDNDDPVPDIATLSVALDDIAHLSQRGVDWYRTGIIGGGVLAAVIAAGYAKANKNSDNGNESGGGNKPPIDGLRR
jgi:hypothetical protein